MSRASVNRLAQRIRGVDEVVVPRALQPTIHLGVLTGVDHGRNVVNVQTNDPSLKELFGVNVLQQYSPLNLPAEDDVVRMLHFGTSILVLGKHVVSDGAVLLG
jgi:hypothetical protein